jgi:hypothetical protein
VVGYFVYQVAYGMTIGPNGTMTVPGMPGTTIIAPPGSTISNLKVVPEPNGTASNSTLNSTLDSIRNSGFISVVPPGVNATNTYLDLSNPDGKPPIIHRDPLAANDYYKKWGTYRHINTTSTTWTMYNATSGSVSTIRFTDCSEDDFYGGLMTCYDNPTLFYRHLHGHTSIGMWSLYYPPRLTPNEALSLCTFTTAAHNDQSPCKGQDLIVKKLGHHHIELIDSHGGTIHLMRLRYEQ